MVKEDIYYVIDSLGVAHEVVDERAAASLPELFIEGGAVMMAIITLLLVAVFLAAWKAPRWVKELGTGALVAGVFGSLHSLSSVCDLVFRQGLVGGIPVLCRGIWVSLIPVLYSLIVYFISLIIRILQKPRL